MLTVNLFDLSDLSTFTNSVFMSFITLLYAVPSMNTLVSSANNMEKIDQTLKKKHLCIKSIAEVRVWILEVLHM